MPFVKGNTIGDKLVNDGSSHVRISQRSDRIETLLIGAVPENVRALVVHLAGSSFSRGLPLTVLEFPQRTVMDPAAKFARSRPDQSN